MQITYDVNEYGDRVKVTIFDSGHVVRELIPAVEDALTVRQTTLSKLDYMNRFTDAELASIYNAAKSSVAIEVWLEKFKLATEINLDDPRTIAGVQALEAAGMLTAGRAAEILA